MLAKISSDVILSINEETFEEVFCRLKLPVSDSLHSLSGIFLAVGKDQLNQEVVSEGAILLGEVLLATLSRVFARVFTLVVFIIPNELIVLVVGEYAVKEPHLLSFDGSHHHVVVNSDLVPGHYNLSNRFFFQV